MQNFPCLYLIFPRFWGRMDAKSYRLRFHHFFLYRRSAQPLNESPFSVQTEHAPSPRRARLRLHHFLCTDVACNVSMNPHSLYRRSTLRLYDTHENVQTRLNLTPALRLRSVTEKNNKTLHLHKNKHQRHEQHKNKRQSPDERRKEQQLGIP